MRRRSELERIRTDPASPGWNVRSPFLPPSPAGASGLIMGLHRCSSCDQPERAQVTIVTDLTATRVNTCVDP